MADPVTFDGVNRLAILAPNTNNIGADEIYSDWKDWYVSSSNLKYEQAMYSLGGEPLPGGIFTGKYIFLINGWKVRPNERDHTVQINGNLFSEDGSAIDAPTIGTYRVAIRLNTSSLTQIAQADGGGFAGDTVALLSAVPDGANIRFSAKLIRGGVPVGSGLISATVALYGPDDGTLVFAQSMGSPDSRGIFRLIRAVTLSTNRIYNAEVSITDTTGTVVGYAAIPTMKVEVTA